MQCLFLGFNIGYKGVLCYNIQTKKFIVSRSVIHDEDVFPFKQVRDTNNTRATQKSFSIQFPDTSDRYSPFVTLVSNHSDQHIEDSNDNTLQASHQNHHSSSPFGTTSMLPIHSTTQLDVILPISTTPEPYISASNSTHSMTTRLKSGAIDKKNYAVMLISFPEL